MNPSKQFKNQRRQEAQNRNERQLQGNTRGSIDPDQPPTGLNWPKPQMQATQPNWSNSTDQSLNTSQWHPQERSAQPPQRQQQRVDLNEAFIIPNVNPQTNWPNMPPQLIRQEERFKNVAGNPDPNSQLRWQGQKGTQVNPPDMTNLNPQSNWQNLNQGPPPAMMQPNWLMHAHPDLRMRLSQPNPNNQCGMPQSVNMNMTPQWPNPQQMHTMQQLNMQNSCNPPRWPINYPTMQQQMPQMESNTATGMPHNNYFNNTRIMPSQEPENNQHFRNSRRNSVSSDQRQHVEHLTRSNVFARLDGSPPRSRSPERINRQRSPINDRREDWDMSNSFRRRGREMSPRERYDQYHMDDREHRRNERGLSREMTRRLGSPVRGREESRDRDLFRRLGFPVRSRERQHSPADFRSRSRSPFRFDSTDGIDERQFASASRYELRSGKSRSIEMLPFRTMHTDESDRVSLNRYRDSRERHISRVRSRSPNRSRYNSPSVDIRELSRKRRISPCSTLNSPKRRQTSQDRLSHTSRNSRARSQQQRDDSMAPIVDLDPYDLQIGFWNIGQYADPHKNLCFTKIAPEMMSNCLDIMGVSMATAHGIGELRSALNDFSFLFSNRGSKDSKGVGLVLNKRARCWLVCWQAISYQFIAARFIGHNIPFTVVQCYAPREQEGFFVKNLFYDQLTSILASVPKTDMIVVMGDFDARVGDNKSYENIMGQCGLHRDRNNNGKRFVKFCQDHKLAIGGTLFIHKATEKMTYLKGGAIKDYQQIDHIAISIEHRNWLKDVKTLISGEPMKSDHFLVRAHLGIGKEQILRKENTIVPQSSATVNSPKQIPEILKNPVIKATKSNCNAVTKPDATKQNPIKETSKVNQGTNNIHTTNPIKSSNNSQLPANDVSVPKSIWTNPTTSKKPKKDARYNYATIQSKFSQALPKNIEYVGIEIYDANDISGKIPQIQQIPLKTKMHKMLARNLISKTSSKAPQFMSAKFISDTLQIVCKNDAGIDCLFGIIKEFKANPPYEGANLKYKYLRGYERIHQLGAIFFPKEIKIEGNKDRIEFLKTENPDIDFTSWKFLAKFDGPSGAYNVFSADRQDIKLHSGKYENLTCKNFPKPIRLRARWTGLIFYYASSTESLENAYSSDDEIQIIETSEEHIDLTNDDDELHISGELSNEMKIENNIHGSQGEIVTQETAQVSDKNNDGAQQSEDTQSVNKTQVQLAKQLAESGKCMNTSVSASSVEEPKDDIEVSNKNLPEKESISANNLLTVKKTEKKISDSQENTVVNSNNNSNVAVNESQSQIVECVEASVSATSIQPPTDAIEVSYKNLPEIDSISADNLLTIIKTEETVRDNPENTQESSEKSNNAIGVVNESQSPIAECMEESISASSVEGPKDAIEDSNKKFTKAESISAKNLLDIIKSEEKIRNSQEKNVTPDTSGKFNNTNDGAINEAQSQIAECINESVSACSIKGSNENLQETNSISAAQQNQEEKSEPSEAEKKNIKIESQCVTNDSEKLNIEVEAEKHEPVIIETSFGKLTLPFEMVCTDFKSFKTLCCKKYGPQFISAKGKPHTIVNIVDESSVDGKIPEDKMEMFETALYKFISYQLTVCIEQPLILAANFEEGEYRISCKNEMTLKLVSLAVNHLNQMPPYFGAQFKMNSINHSRMHQATLFVVGSQGETVPNVMKRLGEHNPDIPISMWTAQKRSIASLKGQLLYVAFDGQNLDKLKKCHFMLDYGDSKTVQVKIMDQVAAKKTLRSKKR